MSDGPTGEEWGRFAEKLDTAVEKIEKLEASVLSLKANMDKGWGIAIGAVAVLGAFAGEIIDAVKRLLGMGG